MKQITLFLLGLILCTGLFAQTDSTAITDSTTDSATISVMDSIAQMYRLQRKDPKELLLLQKLSPAQIMELEKMKLEKDSNITYVKPDKSISQILVVTLCMLPFIFAIYFFNLYFKNRNIESQRKHQIYMKALELGQPVPEIAFREEKKAKFSRLQVSLLWIGAGVGMTVAGIVTQAQFFGLVIGIIPAFIGIGMLIAYYIEKPKTQKAHSIDE